MTGPLPRRGYPPLPPPPRVALAPPADLRVAVACDGDCRSDSRRGGVLDVPEVLATGFRSPPALARMTTGPVRDTFHKYGRPHAVWGVSGTDLTIGGPVIPPMGEVADRWL